MTAHLEVVAALDTLESAAAGAPGRGPRAGAGRRGAGDRRAGPGAAGAPGRVVPGRAAGADRRHADDRGHRRRRPAGRRADPPRAGGRRPARAGVWARRRRCDRYAPTPAQRRFARTRDRSCRHPGCGNRAGWADLDHVLAHADGGATDCANLCCLCRRHHRLKTHAARLALRHDRRRRADGHHPQRDHPGQPTTGHARRRRTGVECCGCGRTTTPARPRPATVLSRSALGGREPDAHRVDAVAVAGRRLRGVVEQVPQVAVAACRRGPRCAASRGCGPPGGRRCRRPRPRRTTASRSASRTWSRTGRARRRRRGTRRRRRSWCRRTHRSRAARCRPAGAPRTPRATAARATPRRSC